MPLTFGSATVKLKSIEIERFRAVRFCRLELHPEVTVLVGDNASGKTLILDAIRLLLRPVVRGLAMQAGLRQKKSTEPERVKIDDFHQVTISNILESIESVQEIKISGAEVRSNIHLEITYSCRESDVQKGFVLEFVPYSPLLEGKYFINNGGFLPVVAYYGTFRENIEVKHSTYSPFRKRMPRSSNFQYREGWRDILDARTVYAGVNNWFNQSEAFELRHQREVGPDYYDKSLTCVRNAVDAMIENVSNLRMTGLPPRLMVDFQLPSGRTEPLYLDQLSGGYKLILSLVIDLARRMAMINPGLEDPLQSEGIVMIDEIDLHLHPKWQQRIVHQLRRTFPNIQFILTTHSPQVLTTLKRENIRKISWRGDDIHFDEIPSTYGAESGRVLAEVMEVEERPPEDDVEFVGILKKYRELVATGDWDSDEANEALSELHRLSPDDPVLVSLALERRRLAARKSGQS
jgi:predicted ATP-binding protein involved in virulence